MNVLYSGVRLCERFVSAVVQVKGDIKKVNDLFVGFNIYIYISDWICKNGAKDSPFSLYDFTKLLGRFQAM